MKYPAFKKIALVAFFSLIPILGYAQKSADLKGSVETDEQVAPIMEKKKADSWISGYIGISNPTGDFGADLESNANGLNALSGYTASLEGAFYSRNNFGIVVSGYLRRWENDMRDAYKESLGPDGTNGPKVLDNPYYWDAGVVFGLIQTIPTERVKFDIKAKVGWSHASREGAGSYYNYGKLALNESSSKVIYIAGISLRIPLGDEYEGILNGEYVNANHTIGALIAESEHSMSAINIGLGIAKRL